MFLLSFTEVIAAEEVPAALVLLRGQRLRMRGVLLLVLCGGGGGGPLLLLLGDAAAAERDRRRQAVEVVDVCKAAISSLNKCLLSTYIRESLLLKHMLLGSVKFDDYIVQTSKFC